jgi:outer membrane immunogenic protein
MRKNTLTNYFVWAGSAFIAVLCAGFFASVYAGPERIDSKSSKEMPAVTQPCNWTGLYGGLHAGFGGGDITWKDTDNGEVNPEILTHEVPIGFFGGAQLGYNRQFGDWLVLGVESEFEASDVSSDQTRTHGDEQDRFHVRNNWNATIGARAGITSFNNRLLAYFKGGVSFGRWEYDWIQEEFGSNTNKFGDSEWRVAPMAAFGLEYAFNCRWSTNIEYKHLFLQTRTLTADRFDSGIESETYDYQLSQDSIQVGINYKFWRF